MSIQEDMAAFLMELVAETPSLQESQRLAMLAGNGLAQPMADLRARQTNREYQRLAKRLPKDHPRRVAALAKAQSARLQVATIDSQIDRLSVEPKPVNEGEIGVHGYVREGGKPVEGVNVVLKETISDSTAEKVKFHTIACVETDKCGMFAISAKSQGPLTLGVERGRKSLLLDPDAAYTPVGMSIYRIVDLETGKSDGSDGHEKPNDRFIEDDTGKPKQPKIPPKKPDPILTADIRGRTLHSALETLKQRNLEVTSVRIKKGDVSTPELIAVERASGEPSVNLHVLANDRPSARLDAMAALLAHDKQAEGTVFETVGGARDWLRDNKIGSLDDFDGWAKKTAKDIQQDAKVEKPEQASRMKRILARTRKLVREE